MLIGIGVFLSGVADISYLDAVAHGSYEAPAWAASLWPASALVTAIAAWQPVVTVRPTQLEGRRLLVLPLVAMLAAVVLLFVDHFDRVSNLGASLAFATLLVGGVRLWLTLGEHMTLLGTSRGEATTDPLTGLRNRRALVNDLAEQVVDVSPQRPLLLLLFDLNGFKSYNDTYGHPAGDALLTRLGTALTRAVDGRGHAYRMGGDEFCVLAAGAGRSTRRARGGRTRSADRTRRRLRDHRSARHRHPRRARQRLGRRAPRRRPAHVRREERPPRIGRRPERGGTAARPHRTPPRHRRPRRQRRGTDREGRARARHERGRPDDALAGRLAPRHRQGRRARRDPRQARAPRRRGVGVHAPPHHHRRTHPRRRPRTDRRGTPRPLIARTLRRQRLSRTRSPVPTFPSAPASSRSATPTTRWSPTGRTGAPCQANKPSRSSPAAPARNSTPPSSTPSRSSSHARASTELDERSTQRRTRSRLTLITASPRERAT